MVVDHSKEGRRRRVFQYHVCVRLNEIRSGNGYAVLHCILDDLRHLDIHVMGYIPHMPNAVRHELCIATSGVMHYSVPQMVKEVVVKRPGAGIFVQFPSR